MPRQNLNGTWSFRKLDNSEWLPASVPGGVHTDLLALGRIQDPFVSDNEKKVQWVAESDWEYRLEFKPSADVLKEAQQFLVCDGLDTLAEVSLNGKSLGNADNMYRQWRWELTGALKKDANVLSLVFRAPLNFIRGKQKDKPLTGGGDIPGGPHLRKAPCQWGWDWGPKLPPIGIWKDIRLEAYTVARLEDVHVRQMHTDGAVVLDVRVALERWQPAALRAVLELSGPDGKTQSVEAALAADGSADLRISVKKPQLWWPNGYGAQPLYQLRLTLQDGESVLDEREYQLGLRTIQLRREPDEWGESFTFVVNGVPVFAKGADWIPADAFPTRTSDAQLEYLIKSAAGAHMNMLRVWGGGVYEAERFYDLCDRYGLMIWQDFTFACGIYPEDDAFAENVRVEAVENVRRLRHRASLALWCGNNEMEQGWADWGWNKPAEAANQSLKAGYDRLFHHLLADVVAVLGSLNIIAAELDR